MPHLTISGFNDSWGGGFTQIRDDLRSVGFEADYQFYVSENKTMQTRLKYSVFTNKYEKGDSSRLDEMELFVRYPIWQKRNFVYSDFILSAEGGAYLTGNLGGENLQNDVHGAVGVNQLVLPYPAEVQLYPMLGISAYYAKQITFVSMSSLSLKVQGGYRIAPNYIQQAYTSVGFAIEDRANGDFYSLGLGYAATGTLNTEPTRLAVANAETGISINYDMRAGFFNYGIRVYPATNFAVGTIGISIFSDDKKARYKPSMSEPDVLFEFGALLDGGLFMRLFGNPFTRSNDWLNIAFETRYQYWTYGRAELGSDPNQLGHYQQATIGCNISVFSIKPKMQLLPFYAMGIGFRGEYLYKADNAADRQTVNSFATTLEGGLRLKFPSFGFDKNCYYGLCSSFVMSFTNKEEDLIYYDDFQFGKTFYQISVGGFLMIDF